MTDFKIVCNVPFYQKFGMQCFEFISGKKTKALEAVQRSATQHFWTMKGGSNFARANIHVASVTESCIFLSFNRISFIQAQGNRSYDRFQSFYLQHNKICFQPFEPEVSPKQGLICFKSFTKTFLEKLTCEVERLFSCFCLQGEVIVSHLICRFFCHPCSCI